MLVVCDTICFSEDAVDVVLGVPTLRRLQLQGLVRLQAPRAQPSEYSKTQHTRATGKRQSRPRARPRTGTLERMCDSKRRVGQHGTRTRRGGGSGECHGVESREVVKMGTGTGAAQPRCPPRRAMRTAQSDTTTSIDDTHLLIRQRVGLRAGGPVDWLLPADTNPHRHRHLAFERAPQPHTTVRVQLAEKSPLHASVATPIATYMCQWYVKYVLAANAELAHTATTAATASDRMVWSTTVEMVRYIPPVACVCAHPSAPSLLSVFPDPLRLPANSSWGRCDRKLEPCQGRRRDRGVHQGADGPFPKLARKSRWLRTVVHCRVDAGARCSRRRLGPLRR